MLQNSNIKQVSKPILEYINYYRALAIILVVASHSLIWGKFGGIPWRTNAYLFAGGTYLFVFAAGFLFYYLAYKFDYKTYLKKKFINVIMPYIITILPVALIFTLGKDTTNLFYYSPKIVRFISPFIFGNIVNPPTWFIGMIAIYFILAPLFLYIQRNKLIWYLVLCLTFFYTIFTHRPDLEPLNQAHNLYGVLLIYKGYFKFLMLSCLIFLAPYLWGMFICEIFMKHKIFFIQNGGMFLSFFAILYFVYYLAYLKFYTVFPLSRIILLLLLLLLLLCLVYEDKIKNFPLVAKSLKFIADYSFGIFFIHFYFINLLYWHSIYTLYAPKIVNVNHNVLRDFLFSSMSFIVAFGGSILVLFILKFILKKLGVKNTRMFIGV